MTQNFAVTFTVGQSPRQHREKIYCNSWREARQIVRSIHGKDTRIIHIKEEGRECKYIA